MLGNSPLIALTEHGYFAAAPCSNYTACSSDNPLFVPV
ncbi:hypothetical protein HSB1_42080 [Halogranum salarium B-1]|uniref:Uncharacterized protein n=1 Tax=Halogranum salarium B-1 TaxID=1210908 RepID=J2ZA37_9EURY|nr:hypothetical protein HSB1_42080 [Halogranum salarium B-1]